MGRPRRQDARRSLMVSAAGHAIAARGVAQLRVKDVAEHAGMSAGSVLYYYPELDGLLLEVHRDTVAAHLRRRLDAVRKNAQPEQQFQAALATGLPTGPEDHTARLLYEMHARCERSPAHAELMTGLFRREVDLYVAILDLGAAVGSFRPRLSARHAAETLVALEDGLGLHVMSGNAELPVQDARAALQRCAVTLVEQCETRP